MKINQIIYTLATLSLLTACSDDLLSPTYTVGEANNAITLRAGINEGSTGVQTRAIDGNHDANGTYGGGHKTLTQGTALRLRVDGTWLGKTEGYQLPNGTVGASNIASQTTTASVGNEITLPDESSATHNKISMSPQLYWDDYGTADPDNIDTPKGNATSGNGGRGKGLTIYGVAVSGKVLPTSTTEGRAKLSEVSSWTSIAWNVGKPSDTNPGVIDQSTTNGWGDYDLITSNNIRPTDNGGDGTYKFDDFMQNTSNTPSDLIEFTHAMSKVTVVLTAGEGFTIPSGGNAGTFKEVPTVTLLGFNYMGKVDVEGKTSRPTDESWNLVDGEHTAATANITMYLTAGTGKDHNRAEFTALVFPGNKFSANIANDAEKTASSNDPLLELNADGNIYKVTAAQLVKAIAKKDNNNTDPGAGDIEGTLAQGVNYVINITVNKTEITVTATVKDWEIVTAEEEEPVINVNTTYDSSTGVTPTGFTTFSFYRSASDPFATQPKENLLTGYSNKSELQLNNYYAPEGTPTGTLNSSTKWDFGNGNTLYWPTHDTHFHFRGVWPETSTETGNIETVPHVKAVSNDDATQVIEIKNVPYSTTDNYPSNLMIGMPVFTDANKMCNNDTHEHFDQSKFGICATGGLITLNFKYVMSQVEVRMKTSTGNDQVELTDADVEIINGYKDGYVKLGDRTVVGVSADKYELDHLPNDAEERGESPNNIAAANIRHSAIVPQSLTNGSNDLQFKITIYNSGKTTHPDDKDVYIATIKDIKVKEPDDTEAKLIDKWESGKHYIYILDIRKTEIKVTSTITDWVKAVVNDEPIWF